MAATNLLSMPPRVVIVSRRCVRKNKFVDFVGEYHLDLLVKFGAVPVIVPRVTGIHRLLESFEPIHGVLLCEGEDIDPSLYESNMNSSELSPQDLEEIHHLHASDTAIDKEKDSIELRLAKLCLERNIPYLGICRGSQVLNVACGGTLYQDVEKELARKVVEDRRVSHINYHNYDSHRHVVKVVANSPLHLWFKETLEAETKMEILVNSYHHQGVKRLAQRFQPMAFAPDGLVEGFYDPSTYDPDQGNFIIGLQFHPERMRQSDSDEFDYPGCQHVYQEFVKAAIAYKKRISNNVVNVPKLQKLDQTWAKQRRGAIVKSLPLAKNAVDPSRMSHSKVGQDFLKSNTMRSQQEKTGLKVGATANIVGPYLDMLKLQEAREKMAKKIMEKLTVEQISDLIGFYNTMSQACSDILEKKLNDILNIELSSCDFVDLVWKSNDDVM